MKAKIVEILETGTLQKTKHLLKDDKLKITQLFTSIFGIGMTKA